MSDKATVIKEIQAKFTANITDYRKKMEQLSGLVSNMTKNMDAAMRTAASAMKSPSASTQKLGRALDATTKKLQGQKEKFDGLANAGARTSQQMEQLNQKLSGMSSAYHAIQAAASTIDLSTPIQKQADAAKTAVEQIDIKIEGLAAAIKNAGKEKFVFLDSGEMLTLDQARVKLDQLAQSGVEAASRFDRLDAALRSIGADNLGYASAKGVERLKSKIDATTSKLENLGDKLSGTSTKAERLASSMRDTKQSMDQQSKSLSKAARLFDALKSAMSRIGSSAGNGLSAVRNKIAGIGNSAGTSTSRVERLLRSIRRISLAHLALRVVRPIFGELTSSVNRYMEQNAAAAASIERLRNGLTNALAPAINVVINLLNQIMPYLIGIADAVASLITNLFGAGWTTISTGADAAANSTDKVAKSTKKAADEQKKYNKLLAGFDEITKLEDQDSSKSSDSTNDADKKKAASTVAGIAGKLPKWLKDFANQLKKLFNAGDFAGIGKLLAKSLGNVVDYLDSKLNSEEFRRKVSNACQHVIDIINGFFDTMKYSDGAKSSIATRTGNLIGDALTLCMNTLNQFLTGVHWGAIGITVAQCINGVFERLTANDVNFGTILANLINAGINALSGFVNTLEWGKIGEFIGENVESFFKTTDWKKAGETARELIEGLGELISSAISSIDWSTVKQAFEDFLAGAGWVGDLALDVALVFGMIKAFGAAEAILTALGFNVAANTVSDPITKVLSIVLALGSGLAIEGLSGLWAMLFGTDAEKEAAREKAQNSGIWWTLGSGIAKTLNRAGAAIIDFKDSLVKSIQDGWKSVKEWWSNYVERVGEKLQCFAEVKNQVGEWWSNVKSWWGERFLSIKLKIDGIISNIRGGVNWVMSSLGIPYQFASGGVIDRPTYAVAGEDGPEAVVPLKNNTEWTGVVAKLITQRMMYRPTPTYVKVPSEGGSPETSNKSAIADSEVSEKQESLLREILSAIKNAPLCRVDDESIRKYVILETNRKTIRNGGECELIT